MPWSSRSAIGHRRSAIGHRRSAIVWMAALLIAPAVGLAQYTFEEVASGLKHPDPATRIRAIQILKEAKYVEAAAPIAATLEDPDDRVQLEAIDAERSLFMVRPVAIKRKVGFVIEVRSGAIAQTLAAGQIALLPRRVPREVLLGLAAAMRDANPRVRMGAMDVFGLLAPLVGPEAAEATRGGVAWTLEALRRGDPPTQAAAATAAGRALRTCGSAPDLSASLCAEVGNTLIDAINSREPRLRRAAMQALGEIRYPYAAQALADQLSYYQRGPDAEAALQGLAGIGHETSASIFKRHLTSSNADMRRLAVEGLARSGQPEDLTELNTMARGERSNGVLLALHFATLKLGAPSKPDQLVAALRDTSLQPLALQYLLELSPSIGSLLVGSLQSQDSDTRALVADVLGFSGDPKVLPALEAATKDRDAETAGAARRAIDRIALASGEATASPRVQ